MRRKRKDETVRPRIAVGYCRVSTSRQAEEGVSLDMQRSRITAWCEAHGYALLEVHEDAGISGRRTGNRPGLQAAIQQACAERAAFVVWSMSRASRSTRDMLAIVEQLDQAGADLVSLSESLDTTGPAGRLVFRVLAAMNEFQSDIIAETTRENMQHAASRGGHMGRAPRGLRLVEKRLDVDPAGDGLALVRRAGELRGEGLSYAAVALQLEAEGFTAERGRRIRASTIHYMLANPAVSAHVA